MTTDKVTHITTIPRLGMIYDIHALELMGWTDGDGTGTEGYNLADYFDAAGKYLGPDICGIEPMVRIAGYVRRQYRIAFMLEATGDFEIVKEFEALNDDDANRYAETNYDGQQWYVLNAAGENINA